MSIKKVRSHSSLAVRYPSSSEEKKKVTKHKKPRIPVRLFLIVPRAGPTLSR